MEGESPTLINFNKILRNIKQNFHCLCKQHNQDHIKFALKHRYKIEMLINIQKNFLKLLYTVTFKVITSIKQFQSKLFILFFQGKF